MEIVTINLGLPRLLHTLHSSAEIIHTIYMHNGFTLYHGNQANDDSWTGRTHQSGNIHFVKRGVYCYGVVDMEWSTEFMKYNLLFPMLPRSGTYLVLPVLTSKSEKCIRYLDSLASRVLISFLTSKGSTSKIFSTDSQSKSL